MSKSLYSGDCSVDNKRVEDLYLQFLAGTSSMNSNVKGAGDEDDEVSKKHCNFRV